MKKSILCSLLVGGLLFSSVNIFAAEEANPTASQEIHNDNGSDSVIRSQSVDAVVRVYQGDASVQTNFFMNLGTVDLVVKNSLGSVVYKKTVYAVNGSEVLINTSAWSVGQYSLSISVPMEDVVYYNVQVN